MFLKSVSRLPDYRILKNDSHEAWKCSVTTKKYFERPHTAVFRRQRLGTTPSTQIFKQDDRFGAKRRRLLLWSVREHLIWVVQRSALVSTDKLWLSRLSFFGMDYSLQPSNSWLLHNAWWWDDGFEHRTVCKMQCVCKMQGVGRTNTRLVHIFAAAFDWRILPPYQYTLA